MKRLITLLALATSLAATSPALAEGWELQQPTASTGIRLLYKGDEKASYLFECTESDVVLTELGVTDLMDLQTGKKVGDTPGSVMTMGASMMALSTDIRGEADFKPAEARPNAVNGWDLTIHLPKKDKSLRSMRKASMVSVFTTGYTMAVALSDPDKTAVQSFLTGCAVAP